MRISTSAASLLLVAAQTISAYHWGFKDGSIAITAKGAGIGSGVKETLTEGQALKKSIELGPTDSLKLLLTTQDGKTAKRPHQTYLSLTDPAGLETSFPLQVKDSGKGKLELTQKDIPLQLLSSTSPLSASLIIGSFGESKPLNTPAFTLIIKHDPSTPFTPPVSPLRYGRLEEIKHIFRADPKNPPKFISLFFTLAVLIALPALFVSWMSLGANGNHLNKAMSAAPVAHALYFGGIVAMEGILGLYYTSWNLFQILPVAGVIGVVILLSGSKALTEVQDRRLAGLR